MLYRMIHGVMYCMIHGVMYIPCCYDIFVVQVRGRVPLTVALYLIDIKPNPELRTTIYFQPFSIASPSSSQYASEASSSLEKGWGEAWRNLLGLLGLLRGPNKQKAACSGGASHQGHGWIVGQPCS